MRTHSDGRFDGSFNDIINRLNGYWQKKGCVSVQAFWLPIGAGTLHPVTVFGCLGNSDISYCYVQPCIRAADGRKGESTYRLMHYYQYQMIMRPIPLNAQEMCIKSFQEIGLDIDLHDIRFLHDDWENPSIGAAGVGWEVWCDGMEIAQFTFMQKMGGIELDRPALEITYGLERIIGFLQKKDDIFDIVLQHGSDMKYSDLFKEQEKALFAFVQDGVSSRDLQDIFRSSIERSSKLVQTNQPMAGYYCALNAIDSFNKLEAQGAITHKDRAQYMGAVKNAVQDACLKWQELHGSSVGVK